MVLREAVEARLDGFDELAATTQIDTLRAVEADLREALSADVPASVTPAQASTPGHNSVRGQR